MTHACITKDIYDTMPRSVSERLQNARFGLERVFSKLKESDFGGGYKEFKGTMERFLDHAGQDAAFLWDGITDFAPEKRRERVRMKEGQRKGDVAEREARVIKRVVFNDVSRVEQAVNKLKKVLPEKDFEIVNEAAVLYNNGFVDAAGRRLSGPEFADALVALRDKSGPAARRLLDKMGFEMAQLGIIPQETWDHYKGRYSPQVWLKDEKFLEPRKLIAEKHGLGEGEMFGFISGARSNDPKEATRGAKEIRAHIEDLRRKKTKAQKRGDATEVAKYEGRIADTLREIARFNRVSGAGKLAREPFDERRVGRALIGDYQRKQRRSLHWVPDEEFAAAHADLLKEADEWAARGDEEGLATAEEFRRHAKTLMTFTEAKAAGLDIDVVRLLKAVSFSETRLITAEKGFANFVENLSKPYLDQREAEKNGFVPLTVSSVLSQWNNVVPISERHSTPSLKKLTEPVEGLLIEQAPDTGLWHIISPEGHYGPDRHDVAMGKGFASEAQALAESQKVRLYGWKPVATHLNAMHAATKKWRQFYNMAVSAFAEIKTSSNPPSHMRNLFGNTGMILASPDYALIPVFKDQKSIIPLVWQAFQDLRKGGKEIEAQLNESTGAGATSADHSWFDDGRALEYDVAPDDWAGFKIWLHKAFSKKVPKLGVSVNDVRRFARKMWTYEDQLFRFAVYRDQRARGLSPDQAKQYLDRYLPNADLLSPFARKMARHLPFTGFAMETARIASGHLKRGIFFSTPEVHAGAEGQMLAIRNMAPFLKLMAGAFFMKGLGEIAMSQAGYDDEERETMNRATRGLRFVVPTLGLMRGPAVMDATFMLPMGDFATDLMQDGDLLPYESNASTALRWMGYPGKAIATTVLQSNPVVRSAYELTFGRQLFRDQPIYSQVDTTAEKAAKMAAYMASQYLPNVAIYGAPKVAEYMMGTENMVGKPKREWLEVAAYLSGVGLQPADPELQDVYQFLDFKRRGKEIQGQAFKAGAQGKYEDAQEYYRRYAELMRAYAEGR
jgi:hypothetical protein